MAKATATCTCATCGATFTRTRTCYNRRAADEWESWASGTFNECTKCWQSRKDREHTEENARAAEAAEAAGLPELTGTPKQIAWATTIRQKAIDAINADCDRMAAEIERRRADLATAPEDKAARRRERISADEARLQLVRKISAQMIADRTAASWWIDHRDGAYLLDLRERLSTAY